jgi:hypothetical protein
MRYATILILLFVLGCKKDDSKTELPECRLASFSYLGDKYELAYQDDRIVKAGDDDYRLTYSANGKLVRIERPFTNPTERTELIYNNDGKIYLQTKYEKTGTGSWVEFFLFKYSYSNGKVIRIDEEYPTIGLVYDKEVVWEGENIRSIITRSNNTILCTQQYAYDLAAKNPLAPMIGLYYSDNSQASFKLALYISANLLTKEENTCPSSTPTNISYEINSKMLLQSISFNGQKWYSYEYSNCP